MSSAYSQNVLDGLAPFPAGPTGVPANHIVHMLPSGEIEACPTGSVTSRLGVAVHGEAVQGRTVSVTVRQGVDVGVIASGACTAGSLVTIGATPGQVLNGATNPVGIALQDAAAGEYVEIRLI